MAKPRPPVRLEPAWTSASDADAPEIVAAGSLILGIFRESGITSWDEMPQRRPRHLVLDDAQIDLLGRHSWIGRFIRFGRSGSGVKTCSMVACAACGHSYGELSSKAPAARCPSCGESATFRANPARKVAL